MNSVGNRIDVVNIILLDGENIPFDASLVLYIYIYICSTNIPPIMIMNKMYENQHLLYIVPPIRENNCCASIFPTASECFNCVNFFQNVVKTLDLSVAF